MRTGLAAGRVRVMQPYSYGRPRRAGPTNSRHSTTQELTRDPADKLGVQPVSVIPVYTQLIHNVYHAICGHFLKVAIVEVVIVELGRDQVPRNQSQLTSATTTPATTTCVLY